MSTVTILNLSQLQRFKRLDAEYYQPEYLRNYEKLKAMGSVRLGDKEYAKITDGIHSSIDYDPNSGIRCLSAQSVKRGYFDLSANTYISREQHNRNPRTHLRVDDVIISSVGTIGNCAAVIESILPSNADRHVGIVRTTDRLDPYYLCAFLNSKYGRFQTLRESTGNVQKNLFIDKMKELLIPILPEQKEIGAMLRKAASLINDSENRLERVKKTLLNRLGYPNTLSAELIYTSSLKQVKKALRLDPQYFQPKYDRLFNLIRLNSSDVKRLGDIVGLSKGYEVGSEAYQSEGVPFIRVSNVNEMEINPDGMKYISEDLYRNFKGKYTPKVSEILITKDATAGVAYVVRDDNPRMISSGILIAKMRTDDDPDYIVLAINSPFVRQQIERDLTGSVIVHWKPSQVRNTLIPLLDLEEQKRLGDLVRETHHMWVKAKETINRAIQRVEDLLR